MRLRFPIGLLIALCLLATPFQLRAEVPPTFKNVKYGPHRRNTLNFWRAKSKEPAPAIIFIHGGGWASGEKADTRNESWLNRGISLCTINYRLIDTAILPGPVHDAALAVQFLRSKAGRWNIDKDRIALIGGSSGGCTSLWLAFHNDLADPDNSDPVLRESTRVCCAVANNAQTTLNPYLIEKWIGINGARHNMICRPFGAKDLGDLTENWGKFRALSAEFSPILHYSKDDPPVYLNYARSAETPAQNPVQGIHHPKFGIMLKERIASQNGTCYLRYKDMPDELEMSSFRFLIDHLLGPDKSPRPAPQRKRATEKSKK